MQTKLTLRLDSELIARAKEIAAERETSVSQLVANYIGSLKSGKRAKRRMPDEEELPPLTRSLLGSLAGRAVDEKDHRAHLERKHR